jgi:hypothetical protein
MARIKVPEFKENEQITSDQFNEVNEAFTGFTVNGENLANEAINQSMVEDESSFSSVQSTGNNLGFFGPSMNPNTNFWRSTRDNWMFSGTTGRGAITVPTVTTNDNVLVRVSCRVRIDDVGAKTFFSGRTPIVKLMLAYRTNVDGGTGDDTGWTFLNETCQEFRMAFSTKIPSDSSLSELTAEQSGVTFTSTDSEGDEVIMTLKSTWLFAAGERGLSGTNATDRIADAKGNPIHRDTTDPSETGVDRYSLSYKDYNSLHGDFSYTTGYLFNTNTDLTNVQFALWGVHYGFDDGGGHDAAGDYGNLRGCKSPTFEKFQLSEFNIYGYKIQKSRT